MTSAGIEAMNVFGGTAVLDVARLARHRGLDISRFENLLMREKAVPLACEDPVTFAVNAARPILDQLDPAARDSIELLVTCSESGIDFGKSISTYVHHHLGLSRRCRLFEIKQACYSGTAGLQMAVNAVLSRTAPGARALVIATDLTRCPATAASAAPDPHWSFVEPSCGAGSVAMLVSDQPDVFMVDAGANGYYGYEVMDTCRPLPDGDAGDPDLSLLSYLDCCERAYELYCARVEAVDYRKSFQYLAFHTPFGGMVKGAHRTMMRKLAKANGGDVDADFDRRVRPGLTYCQRVGNILGGTIFVSLASTIDNGNFATAARVGCFSYGSGCCSEFYSGVVSPEGQQRQRRFAIRQHLDARYNLAIEEYESVLHASRQVRFGMRDASVERDDVTTRALAATSGRPHLVLTGLEGFHRKYEWVS